MRRTVVAEDDDIPAVRCAGAAQCAARSLCGSPACTRHPIRVTAARFRRPAWTSTRHRPIRAMAARLRCRPRWTATCRRRRPDTFRRRPPAVTSRFSRAVSTGPGYAPARSGATYPARRCAVRRRDAAGAGPHGSGIEPPDAVRPADAAVSRTDRSRAGRPPAPSRPDPRSMGSALPADYRPETGPRKELPPQFRRTLVNYQHQAAGRHDRHRYARAPTSIS